MECLFRQSQSYMHNKNMHTRRSEKWRDSSPLIRIASPKKGVSTDYESDWQPAHHFFVKKTLSNSFSQSDRVRSAPLVSITRRRRTLYTKSPTTLADKEDQNSIGTLLVYFIKGRVSLSQVNKATRKMENVFLVVVRTSSTRSDWNE